MADYPSSIAFAFGTQATPSNGHVTDIATDGSVRSRLFHTETTYMLDVSHIGLTDSEKATLLAHYDAEKKNTFNIAFIDGVTYAVIYTSPPMFDRMITPSENRRWVVRVQLAGRVV